MRPEDPLAPEDSPNPLPASLDPSEEEALLRHLSRYQAHKVRQRQGRKLVAAGTLVAGAAVVLVVAGIARSPRPPAPPSVAAPTSPTGKPGTLSTPAPAARPDRTATVTDRVASTPPPPAPPTVAPSGPTSPRPVTLTSPAPVAPTPATPATITPPAPVSPPVTAPLPDPPTADPTPPPPRTPASGVVAVAYQPRERLATVSPGDTKEKVFDRFGTTFEQRNGSVVRIDGMRLRASGRSPRHAHVEVAEITLTDAAAGRLHWFLFGDGRLVAWGRPEEWPATVRRHEIEIAYAPGGAR